MADSLDAFHGTSDELVDPYCDPCNAKGLNVRVHGFCKDCVQFLCSDCHGVHGNLQACRHHDVVQGKDMPLSQADKPPRFDYCDIHPKLLKDQFCCEHRSLLCSLCSTSDHKSCSTKTVQDACKAVDAAETDALYKNIKRLQDNLKSALPSVDKKIKNIQDQEKAMLNDAQKLYDQMIAKAKTMFGSIKNEIQTSCQSQITNMSRHQKKVSDIITKLDSPLSEMSELKDKSVDTKLFLRLQEIVSYKTKLTTELQESRKSVNFGSLSFVPSQNLQEFLSSSCTIGALQTSESKIDSEIVVPKIMFPVSPLKQKSSRPEIGQASGNQNLGGAPPKAAQTPGTQSLAGSAAKPLLSKPNQPLSQIKATKKETYNIKQKNDRNSCGITGMSISKDRRLLMADYYNNKIKMFSPDMKFLSSVSVPGQPWDIAVISDKEAAVTTDNKSLVILDISGSKLRIKTTTRLSYGVGGISRYNNTLIVTSPGSKPEVKLIDQTGRVYWSVSSDQQGQRLFRGPWYVSSHGDGGSSTVIVTDRGNNTLTLLDSDTGEVITRRQLKKKDPRDVTTDSTGNIYVCYWDTFEVAVLSGDLSEEKILLSRQDGLSGAPRAIVHDDEAHQLIISYFSVIYDSDNVHRFQLS